MKRRIALVVAAVLVATLIPATAALAGPKPKPVRVPADVEWVSTGVTVTAGDTLTITARGRAITGPLSEFPGARSDADGQATLCPDGPTGPCALDGSPYGALVGRIDGGPPFFVGTSYSDAASASGALELTVNDNLGFYFDNRGGFNVHINR